MEKLNYIKNVFTEKHERLCTATYDNDNHIYIRLTDKDHRCVSVTLTRKETQRVKRYLEDAITTNIMNWEEE